MEGHYLLTKLPVVFVLYNEIFESYDCRAGKPILRFVAGQRWKEQALVQRMHGISVDGIGEYIHQ